MMLRDKLVPARRCSGRCALIVAAALWVRAQVVGGDQHDGVQAWRGLRQLFACRHQLTRVGPLDKIVGWPISEANVRAELP